MINQSNRQDRIKKRYTKQNKASKIIHLDNVHKNKHTINFLETDFFF